MKSRSVDAILVLALVLVVASGFAHTWQKTTSLVSYGSLGMSADGRIICAVGSGGHPAISTDSGRTWAYATNSPAGVVYTGSTAIAADGSKIFTPLESNSVARIWIFLSSDHGTNWTQTAFPSTKPPTNYYVACSSDGSKVIAALNGGPIFYSGNGGASYYISPVPNAAWSALASSADGGCMVAAVLGGRIYVSSDWASSWTQKNLPSQSWRSVCTSSDGKWIGAASDSNSYISSDGGLTWLTNQIPGQSIATSADGSNWLIAGAQVCTSTNSGLTWQTNYSSSQWYAGAVSADGAEMIAMGNAQTAFPGNYGIFLGRLTPSPQLNIQSQDTNAAISWLIPSTNFVLQQTADLSSPVWTPVTNTSVLNFTNLNQQVSVPANGSNTFFRLIAQ